VTVTGGLVAIDRVFHLGLVIPDFVVIPFIDPRLPHLKIRRSVVFANSLMLTQFKQFEGSEFAQLPTPVWVLDIKQRQILWANRSALDLGKTDCRKAGTIPDWSALGWLDVLGFGQHFEPSGIWETRIVAWQRETQTLASSLICPFSGVRMEDREHALLMQVPIA
jgi:hypothetical protein